MSPQQSQAQQEVGSRVQDGRVSIPAAYLDLVGILGLNTARILGAWKDYCYSRNGSGTAHCGRGLIECCIASVAGESKPPWKFGFIYNKNSSSSALVEVYFQRVPTKVNMEAGLLAKSGVTRMN